MRGRFLARTSSAITLAFAGALAMATLAAAAAPIPTNFNVTAMSGNEAEDAIAVNPTNPSNVVAMSTLPDVVAGLAVGVSFDGGGTWARSVIGASAADPLGEICCDQQLAWDRFGNLWMVYLVNTSGNIPIALSTDGGTTFRKVAEIPANGDQPSIAAGANSVSVSFSDFPGRGPGQGVRGTGHWARSVRELRRESESVPSPGNGDYGDTAVGPAGQVMVTYQDRTGGQAESHIYTSLDPDGLGTAGFGTPGSAAHSHVGGFDYIPAQPEPLDRRRGEPRMGSKPRRAQRPRVPRCGRRRSGTRAITRTSCSSTPTTTERAGRRRSG